MLYIKIYQIGPLYLIKYPWRPGSPGFLALGFINDKMPDDIIAIEIFSENTFIHRSIDLAVPSAPGSMKDNEYIPGSLAAIAFASFSISSADAGVGVFGEEYKMMEK